MSQLRTPSAPRAHLGVPRFLRRGRAAAPPRAAGRGRRLRLARPRRPRLRTAVAAGLLAAVLAAGWLWLRDSSLVAVRDVQVTGLGGGRQAEIRAAIEDAATSMTTLHVREDALRTAVAPFSIVKDIEVRTDFPRGMRVHVISNVAVGAVELGGRRMPVTADGTLLRDVGATDGLPLVPLDGTPAGSRLRGEEPLAALAALGAAPATFRTRIAGVAAGGERGLAFRLENGPEIVLGDAGRAAAKWAAAAAVLADPEAAGALYVDVRAPERPAVGGLPDGAPAAGESDLPALPGTDAGSPDATAEATP